jgi:hypothetical protein
MKRLARVFAGLVAGPIGGPAAGLITVLGFVVGCGRDAPRPGPAISEPYRADIENLCDVVVRSGADQLAPGERALTTATWLAANLKTQDARDYMVAIQPLVGEPKASALDTEARRVGLARCALAAEWRTTVQ